VADTQSIGEGERPLHNPTEGANPPLELTWNMAGELITIKKTIGALSYEKTLTWSGGYPVTISEWVEV